MPQKVHLGADVGMQVFAIGGDLFLAILIVLLFPFLSRFDEKSPKLVIFHLLALVSRYLYPLALASTCDLGVLLPSSPLASHFATFAYHLHAPRGPLVPIFLVKICQNCPQNG